MNTRFIRQAPFVGFTYSGETRVVRTVSSTTKSNSSSKLSPDVDEFDRLRHLYERNRSQLLEQTHQIQEMKEHHHEQTINTRQEQIDYLIRLLNLLPNPPPINREVTSLDNIRTHLEEHLQSFLTSYKRLSTKSSKDKNKNISHDLAILLTKYYKDFSHLFNQTETDTDGFQGDQDNQTIINQLTLFLNDLYANVNKILQEKQSMQSNRNQPIELTNSRSMIPESPSRRSSVRIF